MNNINWDKWFEKDSESMPNCPWIDDEEEVTEQEKEDYKADMEED